MTRLRRSIRYSFHLLVVCASLTFAQGTYIQIDFPAAVMTEATAINAAGDIVGIYTDDIGGHGFLLQQGVYTTIDYPGAQYSYAQGINNKGQVVGLAWPIGYVYEVETHSFAPLQFPGASYTYPLAINDAGTIAGYFQEPDLTYKGFEIFEFNDEAIVPPGSTDTFVTCVSADGRLFGYADVNNGYTAFTFRESRYGNITISGANSPFVLGTNPAGTALVGYYEPITGVTGFAYRNGTLQPLSFPGSISTLAFGINPQGDVVGYFIDSSYATHGFLWQPPREMTLPAESK